MTLNLRNLVRFTAPLLVIILVGLAYGFWAGSGWQSAGSLTYPRWMGGAALGGDGKIYGMGGYVFAKGSLFPTDTKPMAGNGRGSFALDIFDPKTGRSEMGPPIENMEYTARWYVGVGRWTGYEHIEEEPIIRDQIEKWQLGYEAIMVASDAAGRVHWFGERHHVVFGPKEGKWNPDGLPFLDTKSGKWDPPLAPYWFIAGSAATGPDGKIYLTGGVGHRPEDTRFANKMYKLLDVLEVSDPESKTWVVKSPMIQARQLHASAFGPDGKLYVFGGTDLEGGVHKEEGESEQSFEARGNEMSRKASRALDSVECYDPETDTWTPRHPMPKGRQNMGAALGADGRIYVVGGYESYTGSFAQKDVQIYDPKTDTWTMGPRLKTARGNHAVVATPDGKIYAIGGNNEESVVTPLTFITGRTWKRGGPLASVEVLNTMKIRR